MTLELDTLFVWVTDVDRSLDWYQRLGVEPGPRHGPWQEMKVGGTTRFALHEGIRAEGASNAVPSFRVDDLDTSIGNLAERGIEPIDRDITDTGAARFTTFLDPDGNEIQLLQR